MISRHDFLKFALCAAASAGVRAQERFPTRPLKLLVPNTGGTTVDIVARMYADRLSARLGQPVVVENKPGAGGVLAAQAAAQAPRDGYTLLFVNSQHVINPFAYQKLPYDTLRDFEGVALVGDTPSVIAVAPQLGVNSLAELVALAKHKPGQVTYASAGIGSQTHLSAAYFASRAGLDLVHVPYRSAADVITDLMANRTQCTFAPAAYLLPYLQSRRLVALAVTGRERLGMLPDVPTVSEAGVPNFEYSTWLGFVAPANSPAASLRALATEIRHVSEEAGIRQKFGEQGIAPRLLALKDFDGYIRAEMDRIGPVVKAAGIKEK